MSQCLINWNSRSDPNCAGLFEAEEYRLVNDFFGPRPDSQPTLLLHLQALASELGIGDILLKDESRRVRFGLTTRCRHLSVILKFGSHVNTCRATQRAEAHRLSQ